jgi:hypothetical protein
MCLDGALPHMRFLPVIFLVTEAEDEDAHRLLVKLYMDLAQQQKVIDDHALLLVCLAMFGTLGLCLRRTWPTLWASQPRVV